MAQRDDPSIRLSPARRRWLKAQVERGRFPDLSKALDFCVQEAVRLDALRADFDKAIAEGDAGPFERVDERWWARLRADAAARRRARARRKSA